MKITNTVRVDFSIGNYTDTVECDVVPMTVCHLLLGHPWQYDRDIHHNGKANTRQLHWKGKDIILCPMTPQAIVNESRQKTEVRLEQGEQHREPSLAVYDPFSALAVTHFTSCFAAAPLIVRAYATSPDAPCMLSTTVAPAAPAVPATPDMPTAPIAVDVPWTPCSTFLPLRGDADGPAPAATKMTDMGAYILMATKEDLREFGNDPTVIPLVLVYKGEILVSNDNTPLSLGVSTILHEFDDVFPEEVPTGLPPLRGIEHQIDLIPGATLPNHAPYRTNPDETKEFQKQVQALLDKGYIHVSLSPCAVHVILLPKKYGAWHMCVDCRAINNITIRYHHPIPR
jgi:hypothetical protein